MGNFASSALSVMLSWVRTAAAWLWQLASGNAAGGFFAWIGAHWKGLALTLCIAGLLIDWVVYLLRWRPHRVWRSFFRRLRGQPFGETGTASRYMPEPIYAADTVDTVSREPLRYEDHVDVHGGSWQEDTLVMDEITKTSVAVDALREADADEIRVLPTPRRRRRQE